MRIWITLDDGDKVDIPKQPKGTRAVEIDPPCSCGCRAVAGNGKSIESYDTYRADAYCTQCRAHRGVIRAQVDTLFGLEEDERVCNSGIRVF